MKRTGIIDPEHELSIRAQRRANLDLGPLFRLHHNIETSQDKEDHLRRTGSRIGAEILACLRSHGPLTRREINRTLGIDISTVCSTVDALRRSGRVAQLEDKRNGGYLLRAMI